MKNIKAYYVVDTKGRVQVGPFQTRKEARESKIEQEKIVQLAPVKFVR